MDKVGDLLIRIKNGYLASRKEVAADYSKLGLAICELLKKEQFIDGYQAEGRQIKVTLKYSNRQPALTDVKECPNPEGGCTAAAATCLMFMRA